MSNELPYEEWVQKMVDEIAKIDREIVGLLERRDELQRRVDQDRGPDPVVDADRHGRFWIDVDHLLAHLEMCPDGVPLEQLAAARSNEFSTERLLVAARRRGLVGCSGRLLVLTPAGRERVAAYFDGRRSTLPPGST